MRSANLISGILLFLALTSSREVAAGDSDLSEYLTKVGIIPVPTAGVTGNVYQRVDRLVPELKKLSQEQVILLECHYNGKIDRENDLSRAFTIAAQVEKYLREHHKLHVELWLSAHSKTDGNASALTFSVLSPSYRELDRMKAESVMAHIE